MSEFSPREWTEIDGQSATLHRFLSGNVTVFAGDKVKLTFNDTLYTYYVTGPAEFVGCRNDGVLVELRNGSLISSPSVRLLNKEPSGTGWYTL